MVWKMQHHLLEAFMGPVYVVVALVSVIFGVMSFIGTKDEEF
jgi:hypothetical protein